MLDCVSVPYSNYANLVSSVLDAREVWLVLDMLVQRYDEFGPSDRWFSCLSTQVSFLWILVRVLLLRMMVKFRIFLLIILSSFLPPWSPGGFFVYSPAGKLPRVDIRALCLLCLVLR